VQQVSIFVAAFVAGFGFAATLETKQSDVGVVVSEVASSIVSGIILGSNVWAHPAGAVPTDVESRVTASGYALPPSDYSAAAE
jgi:hypothetical protein